MISEPIRLVWVDWLYAINQACGLPFSLNPNGILRTICGGLLDQLHNTEFGCWVVVMVMDLTTVWSLQTLRSFLAVTNISITGCKM